MTLVNIIDRRERPYRFLKVNAVIEPAWHDNSVEDADQAPDTGIKTIGYAERKHVALGEAVKWAVDDADAVTLYLYDEGKGIE